MHCTGFVSHPVCPFTLAPGTVYTYKVSLYKWEGVEACITTCQAAWCERIILGSQSSWNMSAPPASFARPIGSKFLMAARKHPASSPSDPLRLIHVSLDSAPPHGSPSALPIQTLCSAPGIDCELGVFRNDGTHLAMSTHQSSLLGLCHPRRGFVHEGLSTQNESTGELPCTFVGSRRWPEEPSVLIAGCARFIERHLSDIGIAFIEQAITTLGRRVAILVYHDDPEDVGTLLLLREWARRNERVRLILAHNTLPERNQRLAMCRNALWAESLTLPRGAVLAMVDLDCGFGSPSSIFNVVDKMLSPRAGQAFDVISASNQGNYRDMWSLRAPKLTVDYDCFWNTTEIKKRERGHCKRIQILLHPSAPLIEVRAAFNGAAIYNVDAIRKLGAAKCRFHDVENVSLTAMSRISNHRPAPKAMQIDHRLLTTRGRVTNVSSTCHSSSASSRLERVWRLIQHGL